MIRHHLHETHDRRVSRIVGLATSYTKRQFPGGCVAGVTLWAWRLYGVQITRKLSDKVMESFASCPELHTLSSVFQILKIQKPHYVNKVVIIHIYYVIGRDKWKIYHIIKWKYLNNLRFAKVWFCKSNIRRWNLQVVRWRKSHSRSLSCGRTFLPRDVVMNCIFSSFNIMYTNSVEWCKIQE